MARKIVMLMTFLAVELCNSCAWAGVYTDDLSKCLVKSSTAEDQLLLVQWVFSALALHPAVAPFVAISTQQRDTFNRKTAELTQRLLLNDCRKEAVDALKYEGPVALQMGFEVLGNVASRGLMSDSHVSTGLQAMNMYVDNGKMGELFKAAGLPPPPAPATPPAK